MTLQELLEEKAYWENKISEADCWGAAITAASEFLKDCDRWIKIREEGR